MDAYTDFAEVYDIFMDETPYGEWCEFIVSLLQKYGVDNTQDSAASGALKQERNTILDLGCGTGALTELLAAKGYDMIGIDNSQEMLQIAMEKKQRSGYDILYLQQDMREFELYGTVGAVISVCDSINYILDENELLAVFRLVDNYLYPRGLFIFDFNTVYKYEVVIGDATIAENRENCSFIWENYYHQEEEINEYDLTFFVKNDKDNCFKKFSETHYQRGYTLKQMKALVEKSGMEFVDALDADTHKEVTTESERIYVIAREQHKKIS
ncbi:MAG: class I SAM-dependent methyltransferase [Clostridiales bacterium]|nr:class I SAM-dependent methyltransferase [Clostridiales bacterium]